MEKEGITRRREQHLVLLDEGACWQAVCVRDRSSDGHFVFAVQSTGIYCRPSCAARRPRREHVTFFATTAEAERGGFRACKRCRPQESTAPDVNVVEQVCRYIENHAGDTVTLAMLGAHVGLSPFHLQRLFKGIMGMTPRQFVATRRIERFKGHLKAGDAVTGALYGAGYQSSSQLYGEAPARLGMTPSTYRKGGIGMEMSYTLVASPLGDLLVAATTRGLCSVRFGASGTELEQALRDEFPAASIRRDEAALRPWVEPVVGYLAGRPEPLDLPLDVQATAFQARVWAALQAIPYGCIHSYSQVAQSIGQPTAARAVAQACAHNPVALVIPCHRVVGHSGDLGGYRWGMQRKRSLLDREAQAAATDELAAATVPA